MTQLLEYLTFKLEKEITSCFIPEKIHICFCDGVFVLIPNRAGQDEWLVSPGSKAQILMLLQMSYLLWFQWNDTDLHQIKIWSKNLNSLCNSYQKSQAWKEDAPAVINNQQEMRHKREEAGTRGAEWTRLPYPRNIGSCDQATRLTQQTSQMVQPDYDSPVKDTHFTEVCISLGTNCQPKPATVPFIE